MSEKGLVDGGSPSTKGIHVEAEEISSTHSVALRGAEGEEPSFEENVLAEERVRQRTLNSIRLQTRARQDSISSGDGEAVRSPTHLAAPLGEGVERGLSTLSISMPRAENGVREEVDVLQELFEEPEAYSHTVDFQRVIITDTDGEYTDGEDDMIVAGSRVYRSCKRVFLTVTRYVFLYDQR